MSLNSSPRTELLRVAPSDPQGAHRESLVSLLIRTARENDRSPGLLIEHKFSSPSARFRNRALGKSIGQSINGSGEFAVAFAKRTEELTLLTGLSASTARAFAPFTTINGLMRQYLTWSPDFLRASKAQYYPLLWSLDPVRVCWATKKPLISLCPGCRRQLLVLAGAALMARCNRCGIDLTDERARPSPADPVTSSIKSLDYELWIAEQLGAFIQFQTGNALSTGFSFGTTVEFWFGQFALSPNKASAQLIGASPIAMKKWVAEGTIPRLRMTMNLCWVFGVSLLQFLKRELPSRHDGKLRESIDGDLRHASVSSRRPIVRATMESQLTAILRENRDAMCSFGEICSKRLDRRETVVRPLFPQHARDISRRYLENRKLMAVIQQDQFCAAIKAVARFLHSRGLVPNHKTIGPYLDQPSKLRCEWARQALQEIRLELGYELEEEQLSLPIWQEESGC